MVKQCERIGTFSLVPYTRGIQIEQDIARFRLAEDRQMERRRMQRVAAFAVETLGISNGRIRAYPSWGKH